jgi:hypothetical protein
MKCNGDVRLRIAVGGVGRCNGGCIFCDSEARGLTGHERTLYNNHAQHESPEVNDMALQKRSAPSAFVARPEELFEDPEFKDQYPNLHAFLNDLSYADGSKRLTGTLSLFVKGGRLTCGVNDNDRLICAYVNAVTVAELLFKVDLGIGNDSLEWKPKYKDLQGQKPPF